jgi:hypothetical protein
MSPINIKNVKIKNLIGVISNPIYEDLLFEIVNFLSDENRMDGVFNVREASLKTRVRIKSDFVEDINELERLGYIEKLNYTKFEVKKHLWE